MYMNKNHNKFNAMFTLDKRKEIIKIRLVDMLSLLFLQYFGEIILFFIILGVLTILMKYTEISSVLLLCSFFGLVILQEWIIFKILADKFIKKIANNYHDDKFSEYNEDRYKSLYALPKKYMDLNFKENQTNIPNSSIRKQVMIIINLTRVSKLKFNHNFIFCFGQILNKDVLREYLDLSCINIVVNVIDLMKSYTKIEDKDNRLLDSIEVYKLGNCTVRQTNIYVDYQNRVFYNRPKLLTFEKSDPIQRNQIFGETGVFYDYSEYIYLFINEVLFITK